MCDDTKSNEEKIELGFSEKCEGVTVEEHEGDDEEEAIIEHNLPKFSYTLDLSLNHGDREEISSEVKDVKSALEYVKVKKDNSVVTNSDNPWVLADNAFPRSLGRILNNCGVNIPKERRNSSIFTSNNKKKLSTDITGIYSESDRSNCMNNESFSETSSQFNMKSSSEAGVPKKNKEKAKIYQNKFENSVCENGRENNICSLTEESKENKSEKENTKKRKELKNKQITEKSIFITDKNNESSDLTLENLISQENQDFPGKTRKKKHEMDITVAEHSELVHLNEEETISKKKKYKQNTDGDELLHLVEENEILIEKTKKKKHKEAEDNIFGIQRNEFVKFIEDTENITEKTGKKEYKQPEQNILFTSNNEIVHLVGDNENIKEKSKKKRPKQVEGNISEINKYEFVQSLEDNENTTGKCKKKKHKQCDQNISSIDNTEIDHLLGDDQSPTGKSKEKKHKHVGENISEFHKNECAQFIEDNEYITIKSKKKKHKHLEQNEPLIDSNEIVHLVGDNESFTENSKQKKYKQAEEKISEIDKNEILHLIEESENIPKKSKKKKCKELDQNILFIDRNEFVGEEKKTVKRKNQEQQHEKNVRCNDELLNLNGEKLVKDECLTHKTKKKKKQKEIEEFISNTKCENEPFIDSNEIVHLVGDNESFTENSKQQKYKQAEKKISEIDKNEILQFIEESENIPKKSKKRKRKELDQNILFIDRNEFVGEEKKTVKRKNQEQQHEKNVSCNDEVLNLNGEKLVKDECLTYKMKKKKKQKLLEEFIKDAKCEMMQLNGKKIENKKSVTESEKETKSVHIEGSLCINNISLFHLDDKIVQKNENILRNTHSFQRNMEEGYNVTKKKRKTKTLEHPKDGEGSDNLGDAHIYIDDLQRNCNPMNYKNGNMQKTDGNQLSEQHKKSRKIEVNVEYNRQKKSFGDLVNIKDKEIFSSSFSKQEKSNLNKSSEDSTDTYKKQIDNHVVEKNACVTESYNIKNFKNKEIKSSSVDLLEINSNSDQSTRASSGRDEKIIKPSLITEDPIKNAVYKKYYENIDKTMSSKSDVKSSSEVFIENHSLPLTEIDLFDSDDELNVDLLNSAAKIDLNESDNTLNETNSKSHTADIQKVETFSSDVSNRDDFSASDSFNRSDFSNREVGCSILEKNKRKRRTNKESKKHRNNTNIVKDRTMDDEEDILTGIFKREPTWKTGTECDVKFEISPSLKEVNNLCTNKSLLLEGESEDSFFMKQESPENIGDNFDETNMKNTHQQVQATKLGSHEIGSFSFSDILSQAQSNRLTERFHDILRKSDEDESNCDTQSLNNVSQSRLTQSTLHNFVKREFNLEEHEKKLKVIDMLSQSKSIHEVREELEMPDIMEERKKVQELSIETDWSIPLIHRIAYFVNSVPSAEQKKNLRSAGISWKLGKYTKEEDEKIMRNWSYFCKCHNWREDYYEPFLKSSMKSEFGILNKHQRQKFAQFLSRGFENRLMYSVYHRFQRLISENDNNTLRFTEEDDKIISEYVNSGRTDQPFAQLADILKRSRLSLLKRYKLIEEKNKAKNGKIMWNKQLTECLLANLIEVTRSRNLSELKDYHITSKEWKKISVNMNIPENKLKRAWIISLYPRFFTEDYAAQMTDLKRQLVDLLYTKYSGWREVNWTEVAEEFPDSISADKLCKVAHDVVKSLVPFGLRKDLHKALKYVRKHYQNWKEKPDRIQFVKEILEETEGGTIIPKVVKNEVHEDNLQERDEIELELEDKVL